MKIEGPFVRSFFPVIVVPAHAGIQVCSAELAWIHAFAGMTDGKPGGVRYHSTYIFEGGREGHEGSI